MIGEAKKTVHICRVSKETTEEEETLTPANTDLPDINSLESINERRTSSAKLILFQSFLQPRQTKEQRTPG